MYLTIHGNISFYLEKKLGLENYTFLEYLEIVIHISLFKKSIFNTFKKFSIILSF